MVAVSAKNWWRQMPATATLGAGMLVVSLPTAVRPELYGWVGGYKPLTHPWQPVTAAFEHGFHGVPLWVHLGANMLLLGVSGRIAEPVLGSLRFVGVTVLAIFCFALVHAFGPVDGHGASSFIYAYGPVLLVARLCARRSSNAAALAFTDNVPWLLVASWAVIPVIMALVPYAAGWRGDPLQSFVLANAFHFSGLVAGIASTWFWRDEIARRTVAPDARATHGDRLAGGLSVLIPVGLAGIVAMGVMAD